MPVLDGRPTPNQDATVVDSLFNIAYGKFSKLHQVNPCHIQPIVGRYVSDFGATFHIF